MHSACPYQLFVPTAGMQVIDDAFNGIPVGDVQIETSLCFDGEQRGTALGGQLYGYLYLVNNINEDLCI